LVVVEVVFYPQVKAPIQLAGRQDLAVAARMILVQVMQVVQAHLGKGILAVLVASTELV